MVRAGAIAKRVIEELGELGCDSKSGECPEDLKEKAKKAFEGRSLGDYYTEGMIHNRLLLKPIAVTDSCLLPSAPPQGRDLV